MIRKGLLPFMICLFLLGSQCSGDTYSVVDFTEKQVNLSLPIHSIISLSNMATEIICALDGGERLIGRPNSAFPSYIENVEIVGENSRLPDLERIVELDPDLLIADGMLSNENRKKIEDAGIPVIVDKFTDPSRAINVTEYLGNILDRKEKAQKMVEWIRKYEDLIEERTASIDPDEKTKVFVEWNSPYRAASTSSGYNNYIKKTGGLNIVNNSSAQYSTIDPEWLIEQDPDVIIKLASSTKEYSEEDLQKEYDEILGRSELSSLKAIKDGRTHVISGIVVGGIRSVIGELYFAKWFYPEEFKDIDPESIHKEMLHEFFAQESMNCYAYPPSSESQMP